MAGLEAAGVFSALVFTVLSLGWSVIAAAVLYPAFQAMVLRWWISGLRFGELTVRSRLRMGSVYGLYMRFVWYAMIFGPDRGGRGPDRAVWGSAGSKPGAARAR